MTQNDLTMYGNPIPPEQATGKLKKLYEELEEMLGALPSHIQIHATHAIEDMKCFIDPMKFTRQHPEVPLLWFVLMRLFVATKDQYPYCIALNRKMLQNLGIQKEEIEGYLEDIDKAPLDARNLLLLKKAIKSIYDSHHFNQEDFEALYEAGYSDKTIYGVVSYSTGFSGIAKRLNTYLVKAEGNH